MSDDLRTSLIASPLAVQASMATITAVRPSGNTNSNYGYHMTETSSEDEYGFCSGCFTFLLTVISVLLILCTLPFSLCVIMRMVQVTMTDILQS